MAVAVDAWQFSLFSWSFVACVQTLLSVAKESSQRIVKSARRLEFRYFLKSNQLYCGDVCFGLRDEVFTQRPFVPRYKLVNWLTGSPIPRFSNSPCA